MKRRDVIRHLEEQGCEFLREGGNHTVYVNRAKRKENGLMFRVSVGLTSPHIGLRSKPEELSPSFKKAF